MEQELGSQEQQSEEDLIRIATQALANNDIVRFSGRPMIIYDMRYKRDIYYNACPSITVDCVVNSVRTMRIDPRLHRGLEEAFTGEYKAACLTDVNAEYEYFVALRKNELATRLQTMPNSVLTTLSKCATLLVERDDSYVIT